MLRVAQLIRKFVCHGNPQFSYCLQELTKLGTNPQLMCLLAKFVYCTVSYMCILRTLVHTTVSGVVDLYGVLLVVVNKNTILFTFNCVCRLTLSFTQNTVAAFQQQAN
jgi:hypothetical protein